MTDSQPDRRAELRAWYVDRLRPKVAAAVSREEVSLTEAFVLDDAMRALLRLPREGRIRLG